MDADHQSHLRRYQALLAPGTQLRDGLERILSGRTGALIVLGNNRLVKQVCTGGFDINVDYTPTALRELAKMDGAIVLSHDLGTIIAAGVHLVPPGDIATTETGTRHRSADRVSKHTGAPTVTVSASMSTISLFIDGDRHTVARSEQLLSHANQALATLAKYRDRLTRVLRDLTSLEVRDQVTVRDVATVAQRYELVTRLAHEVEGHVVELGDDGRLVKLQLDEYARSLDDLPDVLAADYAPDDCPDFSIHRLSELSDADLLDLGHVAKTMGFPSNLHADSRLSPRGVRLLRQIGRVPTSLVLRMGAHFGSLQQMLGASASELQAIDGIGAQRARAVREGLVHLVENSYLDEVH